jgi:hypothetical protein
MDVYLRGSSPASMTAAIMILTRARQLGDLIDVSVVGDPEDIVKIPGPAVCYAPVLASCGVGRKHGSGATVVVSGPPSAPVLVTVQPHGIGGWFEVDRTGKGYHPATEAYTRVSNDPRIEARHLGKELRRLLESVGMSTDPAILDVLFSAPVPTLTRLAVALRAGRSLTGGRGQPITRYLDSHSEAKGDPLPDSYDPAYLENLLRYGGLDWIMNGLSTAVRDRVDEWVENARSLAADDHGRDLVLLYHLALVASHLVQLPAHSILPPLGAAEDSVAVGLKSALLAEGDGDANIELRQMFRFLGGRFVADAQHLYEVESGEPPEDHIGRWEWFCAQVRQGRKQSEELWPNIIDPPQ